MSAKNGQLECLKILFDYGASLNTKTIDFGYTPLHLAAVYGHFELVKWLCDHKAKTSILDKNSKTPADLARENNHADIENYLVSI